MEGYGLWHDPATRDMIWKSGLNNHLLVTSGSQREPRGGHEGVREIKTRPEVGECSTRGGGIKAKKSSKN